MTAPAAERWFVPLDIDGTILLEDGVITDRVLDSVRGVRDRGHEITLATGRSVAMTLPILDRLDLAPEYIVCCNGAVTLRRDPDAPVGYRPCRVETFVPREVLMTVHGALEHAAIAVEDESGSYRYSGAFPEGLLGAVASEHVEFEQLLDHPVTRVVVLSPRHGTEEFLEIVERMGLHQVSYNVGWTAWLDIAPDGVNKSTAAERVRAALDVPRERVMAVGDGRNDVEFLAWAGEFGRGVAMGQAPHDVREVASEVTGRDVDDGLADALDSLP